jgi:hypothetical protein
MTPATFRLRSGGSDSSRGAIHLRRWFASLDDFGRARRGLAIITTNLTLS